MHLLGLRLLRPFGSLKVNESLEHAAIRIKIAERAAVELATPTPTSMHWLLVAAF